VTTYIHVLDDIHDHITKCFMRHILLDIENTCYAYIGWIQFK